ncbi:hypothetical protein MRX96_008057 [Rhipicephalus microplus]
MADPWREFASWQRKQQQQQRKQLFAVWSTLQSGDDRDGGVSVTDNDRGSGVSVMAQPGSEYRVLPSTTESMQVQYVKRVLTQLVGRKRCPIPAISGWSAIWCQAFASVNAVRMRCNFTARDQKHVLYGDSYTRQRHQLYCSVHAFVRMRFGAISSPSAVPRATLGNTRRYRRGRRDESIAADNSLPVPARCYRWSVPCGHCYAAVTDACGRHRLLLTPRGRAVMALQNTATIYKGMDNPRRNIAFPVAMEFPSRTVMVG